MNRSFISLVSKLALCIPLVACSWPEQTANKRLEKLSKHRELFLSSLNFKEALHSTPKFYRLQVASQEEWAESFRSFRERYNISTYTKLLNTIGEEDLFWCLEHQVIPPQESHIIVFKDIKENNVRNLKDLLILIPEKHIRKLHQVEAISSADLHFFFKNFIKDFPKADLINWRDTFTWQNLKHFYYLGAIEKEDMNEAFFKSIKKQQKNDLHELLSLFPFEQIRFLHEERMLATSWLQKSFYMIRSDEDKYSFSAWINKYGHKDLSYLIAKGIIPSYLVKKSLDEALSASPTFSSIMQEYQTPLLSLMVRMHILDKKDIKDAFNREIAQSDYPHIHTIFKKLLKEHDIAWLERASILSPHFWDSYDVDNKLIQEFQDYNFSVVRESIFPLPSYFEKHLQHFPSLRKAKSMEKEYQKQLAYYQRKQDKILTQFQNSHNSLLEKKQQELSQARSEHRTNEQQKEEILSRYDYLVQRSEVSRDNDMAEAEREFEDKVNELTKTWKTL
ncbi:MAG: hypothetical protein GWP59_07815 [Chlamydiales bacterium]|nr:hypothetical protein [Chlamydiales bacterium]NCF71592.1 hypothetical protein [Chlamydiales bacterium]